jgi:hypothetical protein
MIGSELVDLNVTYKSVFIYKGDEISNSFVAAV